MRAKEGGRFKQTDRNNWTGRALIEGSQRTLRRSVRATLFQPWPALQPSNLTDKTRCNTSVLLLASFSEKKDWDQVQPLYTQTVPRNPVTSTVPVWSERQDLSCPKYPNQYGCCLDYNCRSHSQRAGNVCHGHGYLHSLDTPSRRSSLSEQAEAWICVV